MATVTLIGSLLAEVDTEFLYIGPLSECKNCKLKTVCFNLTPGHVYKITSIREKHHPCQIHAQDVVVVEVEKQPIITAIPTKEQPTASIEGEKIFCPHIGCDHYDLCTNPAVQEGKTYTVKKNLGKMSCLCNHDLYKVELSDQ